VPVHWGVSWLLLIFAGVLEIAWALTLKSTQGWTRPWPSLATLALMGLSFYLLSRAMRDIPVGTAYAVWTGIGSVGVALFGMAVYKEPATVGRVLFMMMIVAGIVGLKLVSGASPRPSP
jgi:quaternary ammonium compound-resistance protein SugE